MAEAMHVLAIDTCGPSGSVALGRLSGQSVEILAQTELAGRSYSATLIAAIAELLTSVGIELKQLGAIVATNGPGSFTGVRVGLSAVKGLAEPAAIPVVAVSRLAVLAFKSNVPTVALDAHRHEVFLRIGQVDQDARELIAGAAELAALIPSPLQIAACDDAAAALLSSSWPTADLVRVAAPTAADALELAAPLILAGRFVDLALLDGHYLRRSDAEIFGEPTSAGPRRP
jgi:tRNA threonylcarbamoyladenosine biosynthesis protein TsaB